MLHNTSLTSENAQYTSWPGSGVVNNVENVQAKLYSLRLYVVLYHILKAHLTTGRRVDLAACA